MGSHFNHGLRQSTMAVLQSLETLFGASPERAEEFFYVADRDNQQVGYVSSSYETVWGGSPGDLGTDPMLWMQAIHSEDIQRVRDAFKRRPDLGFMDIEYRILRADQQVRYIHDRSLLLREGPDGELFVVGRCQDVTIREQQRLAQRVAEAGVRARDEVLAVVSHDLRNPLCAVDAVARRLSKALPDEKRQACVEALRAAVRRMTRLLDDLLDVSRMEAGQFAVKVEAVAPQAVLDETLVSFQDIPGSADIELHGTIDANVPAMVPVDSFRLVQVLTNLVGNAFKFTPKGGRIDVRASRFGDTVRFAVTDTGIGIQPENQAHLFDRFWQADRTDRRGAGLGLSIAKGIVEAHRGTIWMEPMEQGGSRFTVELPLNDKRT